MLQKSGLHRRQKLPKSLNTMSHSSSTDARQTHAQTLGFYLLLLLLLLRDYRSCNNLIHKAPKNAANIFTEHPSSSPTKGTTPHVQQKGEESPPTRIFVPILLSPSFLREGLRWLITDRSSQPWHVAHAPWTNQNLRVFRHLSGPEILHSIGVYPRRLQHLSSPHGGLDPRQPFTTSNRCKGCSRWTRSRQKRCKGPRPKPCPSRNHPGRAPTTPHFPLVSSACA